MADDNSERFNIFIEETWPCIYYRFTQQCWELFKTRSEWRMVWRIVHTRNGENLKIKFEESWKILLYIYVTFIDIHGKIKKLKMSWANTLDGFLITLSAVFEQIIKLIKKN